MAEEKVKTFFRIRGGGVEKNVHGREEVSVWKEEENIQKRGIRSCGGEKGGEGNKRVNCGFSLSN